MKSTIAGTLIAVSTLSLALAGGLAAQQPTDTAPKSSSAGTAAKSTPSTSADTASKSGTSTSADTTAKSTSSASAALPAPIAGKATLGVAIAEEALVATGWRASKLKGAAVYNEQNQKIGKIDDFIVSPDGALTVAVVEVGGFLGLAGHKVAIPVKQLGGVAPKVVLKGATKEALKALPEFKYLA